MSKTNTPAAQTTAPEQQAPQQPQPQTQPDLRPEPPVPPEPGDCCHSGCAYCVDDIYQDALDQYRVDLKAWQERQP
jgi:hypothetical protein